MGDKKHRLRQGVRRMRCRLKRRTLRGTTVLAITGSCGKTTTTRFLGKILSDRECGFVGIHDTDANSVMRNLRDTQRTHRFLLQEQSGHEPGHLRKVLPLLRPDIGIVTTVGQDHYRAFRTLEATALEKGSLIEFLLKPSVAVLNADDPHVAAMASRARARMLTYGMCSEADVRASDLKFNWPERLSMMVTFREESVRVENELVLLESNGLECLERFVYGKVSALRCWKQICKKKISCALCEESGLVPSGEGEAF